MSTVGARHDSYQCLEPDRIGVNSIIESIAGGFHDAIVRAARASRAPTVRTRSPRAPVGRARNRRGL
jgi:hypothetical protein